MLRSRKRRGVSEMVGALFILILLVVAFSFALVMFNSFTGYQNAVNTRAQFNAALPRENLDYTKVLFGASEGYNPNTGFLGSFASAAPANVYPITNMNFTSTSAGWVFTREFVSGVTYGMSGNFDPVTFVGSESGPGAIYTDFTLNTGAASSDEAIGNWTSQFTLTPAELLDMQTGASTMKFSLGGSIPTELQYTSNTVNLSLQNATSHAEVLIGSPALSTVAWANFYYTFPGGITAQHSFFTTNNGGTYNLVIYSDIVLKGQSGKQSEVKNYFDDVGIVMSLTNFYSATLCPTFTISQSPLSVQDLTVSFTTEYTQPVTQTAYLYDFAQGAMAQVDIASVGNAATTRFVDLGGLVGGASEVQRFIQTSTATVTIPGCPNSPISTVPGSVIMEVYSVGTASFTGTLSADILTAYYTDTSQFSMQLTNSGTETIHLVSLWVTGSSGATQYASTLGSPYYFSEWVAPGATVSVTVPYQWSSGQYSIELVSARGNIFSDSVTAP
ncbi:MAG: hypothetical protein JRM99_03640 [Nitrososphaerota archaeon]|nr:hypothetical protein [Nitrososphaerota archaeon]